MQLIVFRAVITGKTWLLTIYLFNLYTILLHSFMFAFVFITLHIFPYNISYFISMMSSVLETMNE